MAKIDEHAWNDEACVLRAAFHALEKNHAERISILSTYGEIPEEIKNTIAFEERAIQSVRDKLLNYLEKH